MLGTPTREQIKEMNPNYTEFKFPQIKSHPWQKVRDRPITLNTIFCYKITFRKHYSHHNDRSTNNVYASVEQFVQPFNNISAFKL